MASICALAQTPQFKPVSSGLADGTIKTLYAGACDFAVPVFADLDGDGDPDLFVGQNTGFPMFLRNDGTPRTPSWTFISQHWDLPALSANPLRAAPAFADLDGDGVLDLALGLSNGAIAYYHNDGTNMRPHWRLVSENWTSSTAPGGNARPAFVDIDGDGDLDLFVGSQAGTIAFFRNTGTPTSPQWTWVLDEFMNIQAPGAASPCFFDIDGDGLQDLFVGDAAGRVHYWRCYGQTHDAQNGMSFFYEVSDHYAGLDVAKNAAPMFADLNHDGVYDLFVGSMAGSITWLRNQGTIERAQWAAPERVWLGLDAGSNSAVEAADIEGGGAPGLFVAAQNSATTGGYGIQYYRNTGAPWLPNWELADAQFAGIALAEPAPRFVDIDGDGDLDLFVGSSDGISGGLDGAVHFFRNTGSPQSPAFSEETTGAIGIPNAWSVKPAFCDMDGDGDYDLWVAYTDASVFTSQGRLLYYQNVGGAGGPVWSAAPLDFSALLGGGSFPSVVAGDLDGDGLPDLLTSDESGEVYFHRCLHTTPTLSFAPPEALALEGAESLTCLGMADLNGDFKLDLLLGGMFGGVRYYENCSSAGVVILPHHATAASGSSISFATSEPAAGSWAIVVNRSGASINAASGSYTAGPQTGVDVIRFFDGQRLQGAAYVNVVRPDQMAGAGKAVIMAGRKAGDLLWPVTNRLANSVYQTLLYRGYAKENIYYLNPEPAQDADGNGLNDDIRAPSSDANIEAALTQWARGASTLFVYLIDHGEERCGNYYVRCNESEVLHASVLKGWLDDLQSSGTQNLTLVVDCCQSGGFLDQCRAAAGQQRVVIASAGAQEPAFFSAGGLISFTSAFVNALGLGRTIGEAFAMAAGGVDRYQSPGLDDNGDGVYIPTSDGALAKRLTLGAENSSGADRPNIGLICGNQTLSTGSAATIWASDITAASPLERVWAVIASPAFGPSARTQPCNPILAMPEVELTWNAVNARYEATTDTFTQLGAYPVSIYARDLWGGVSFPKQTYVNQRQASEKTIIVCGDGAYSAAAPHESSALAAAAAYGAARARWLTDEEITYLVSPATQGSDGPPSKAALQAAIAAAAGADQVTILLIGHGNAAGFDVDGDGADADADDVTSAELDLWLDALQAGGAARVVVILDFARSGDWLAALKPPAGKQRVVIASCGAGGNSLCAGGGEICFTSYFFAKAREGLDAREAFRWAKTAMRAVSDGAQIPRLDDDGSGRATKSDGAVARMTWLGAPLAPEVGAPVIGSCAGDRVLDSSTAVLWASGVWDRNGIARVYALLTRTGDAVTTAATVEIELLYTSATARWERPASGLDPSQRYSAVYYAQNNLGQLSAPRVTSLGPALPAGDDLYDRFYCDNTTHTLNLVTNAGAQQTHNFSSAQDEDWIAFNAAPHRLYSIQVVNQARNCDAAISLYDASNLTTPLATQDDFYAGEDGEVICWYSGSRYGRIYVRITQSPDAADAPAEATTYTLILSGDWGNNAGLPTISLGFACIGPSGGSVKAASADVDVTAAYHQPALTVPAGALALDHAFLLDDPGDVNDPLVTTQSESTRAWLTAHPHNCSLVMISLDKGDPGPVALAKPAAIQVEFLKNCAQYSDYLINDLPDGYSSQSMRIHFWDGTAWQVLPGTQTVEGNVVTGELSSIGDIAIPVQDAKTKEWYYGYVSLFAAAPVGPAASPTPSPIPTQRPTATPTPSHSPSPTRNITPTCCPSMSPWPTNWAQECYGNVMDAKTFQHMADVLVIAESDTTTAALTNEQGQFDLFVGVHLGGALHITIWKEGYTTATLHYNSMMKYTVMNPLYIQLQPLPITKERLLDYLLFGAALTPAEKNAADVNQDGVIDVADYVALRNSP